MPEIFLRRHAFVWLHESSVIGAVCESGDPGLLSEWISRGLPFVVRRPCVSEDGHFACLAISQPGKLRHGYHIPMSAILRVEEPPLWKDCKPSDADWPDPGFRTFGSHAWKFLTGLDGYVTPGSDIDLVFDIGTMELWNSIRTTGFQFPTSPRVDLEIIFRRDASFSWREYESPSDKILVKTNRTVQLVQKTELDRFLD